MLEKLNVDALALFRREHGVPGIKGLFVKCKAPDVHPDRESEDAQKGVKTLVDKCNTCGAEYSTVIPIVTAVLG